MAPSCQLAINAKWAAIFPESTDGRFGAPFEPLAGSPGRFVTVTWGVTRQGGKKQKTMAHFLWPEPLSPAQLKRLEEHKYSASGRSLFEPPCQIFWNWLIQQIPTWIAPNTLTIAGLLVNILSTVVLVYFCPTATEEVSDASLGKVSARRLAPITYPVLAWTERQSSVQKWPKLKLRDKLCKLRSPRNPNTRYFLDQQRLLVNSAHTWTSPGQILQHFVMCVCVRAH